MIIPDLFFRRMKSLKGEFKEYYTYEISSDVRYKLGLIFTKCSKEDSKEIVFNMELALGKPLYKTNNLKDRFNHFILESETEELISLIETSLSVKYKNYLKNKTYYGSPVYQDDYLEKSYKNDLEYLIENINKIFKIEKIGYEIVPAGLENLPFMVVPFNSKYLYLETIHKPMKLMYDEDFKGALNEFEMALNEYGNNNYKKAIHFANNSYESVLKTILDKTETEYTKYDNIPKLIDKIKDKTGIIDSSLTSSFDSCWNVLKNGPNTIRNQEGIGHGQGNDIKKVDKSYAEFVLRLVGTYVVFLIERFNEL